MINKYIYAYYSKQILLQYYAKDIDLLLLSKAILSKFGCQVLEQQEQEGEKNVTTRGHTRRNIQK